MALGLTLPATSRSLADIERRPGKVEKWIASLPLLNVSETGHKLCASLQAYNRSSVEPSLRLELLELYRAPIRHIGTELQKQYVGLPLPLPERYRIAAEQHRELHTELAYGYKHVVTAQADPARRYCSPRICLTRQRRRAFGVKFMRFIDTRKT
jgi:cyclic-di-GMP-binding protein